MTGDHVEGKLGDTEYETRRPETAGVGHPDSEQERRTPTVGISTADLHWAPHPAHSGSLELRHHYNMFLMPMSRLGPSYSFFCF